jgi:hypothetical protein
VLGLREGVATVRLDEFLSARLDEEEQMALAATAVHERDPVTLEYDLTGHDTGVWTTGPRDDDCVIEGDHMMIYDEGGHGPADARHIVRHDPASTLLRIRTERIIIKECVYETGRHGRTKSPRAEWLASYIMMVMALRYANHEQYQAEWAP